MLAYRHILTVILTCTASLIIFKYIWCFKSACQCHGFAFESFSAVLLSTVLKCEQLIFYTVLLSTVLEYLLKAYLSKHPLPS
jgi:hypothetical protein